MCGLNQPGLVLVVVHATVVADLALVHAVVAATVMTNEEVAVMTIAEARRRADPGMTCMFLPMSFSSLFLYFIDDRSRSRSESRERSRDRSRSRSKRETNELPSTFTEPIDEIGLTLKVEVAQETQPTVRQVNRSKLCLVLSFIFVISLSRRENCHLLVYIF